jgi:CDP-glycerol glycerophosphotransferase
VRGHAFHARTDRRLSRIPGCIEVTDYPEVSDLYLAADAAVVDYSSLRFDFGVTGKPMIFHVPDLRRYQEARGWLFDFELSAPGPWVATTEEATDRLLHLEEVRQGHAAAYERFTRDFLALEDGHAGERVVDAIFEPRGDA